MICPRCKLPTEKPTKTPSPFTEYFGQNVCVEPATARRVADFLLNARKEEEEMAFDIRTMEASLEQMKAELAAARAFSAKHEVLLSHVHRLPNEILEQIFLLIPGANDLPAIPPTSQDDLDRWHLTWVCQQWRTVAIQATGLWSAINIHHRSYPDNIVPLLELSLSRTRGLHPLFVGISTGQIRATYAIILKYSAQIRFLQYRIYCGDTGLPDDLEAQFESLKQLEVIVDCERGLSWDHNVDLDEYLWRFQLCTSLEVFELRIISIREVDVTPQDMRFPWNSLRVFRLYMEYCSLIPLPDILAACQTLKTLVVDGYTEKWVGPGSDVLELPQLTYVRLRNSPNVTTLPTFNAPSLRTLCLEGPNGNLNAPGPSSLFHSPHLLYTLRLPLSNILAQSKWKDIVVKMRQPLRCLTLQMGYPKFGPEPPYFPYGQPPVLPLARKVRLEFPCHIEGRFKDLIPWVRCSDHLESLTLVYRDRDSEQIRRDCYQSWWVETTDPKFPTYDEAEEWAEERLVKSDFIAQLNSLSSTGVTVEMILKKADGREVRMEDDYINNKVSDQDYVAERRQ